VYGALGWGGADSLAVVWGTGLGKEIVWWLFKKHEYFVEGKYIIIIITITTKTNKSKYT
jgi:hypothetical protein